MIFKKKVSLHSEFRCEAAKQALRRTPHEPKVEF